MSALPPIVFGVDDRFCEPLLVVLCSIAETHPDCLDDLAVHVLHTDLSAGNQTRLLQQADAFGLALRTTEVRVAPGRYPLTGRATEAMYLRLEIARYVDADRALYLDADTLVTGDLRPLLRKPMGGRPIGAVRDPQNPIIGHGIGLPGWAELGLPPEREYFNSGVLLLDLAECRRCGLFERCAAFLAEHPRHLKFWDQDALNYAADDHWLRLERRWNTFPMSAILRLPGDQYRAEHIFPVARLIADEPGAHILHFAGVGKPWLGRLPDGDINQRYAAVRDRALNHAESGHR